jgi:dTDP-4-dehydrorhamnose 3,5-epimerase
MLNFWRESFAGILTKQRVARLVELTNLGAGRGQGQDTGMVSDFLARVFWFLYRQGLCTFGTVRIKRTKLEGVLVLEPRVFKDERGFFLESWNRDRFNEAVGREVEFLQDNHSHSVKGVLRGLHYQVDPMAQGKLITVMSGRIFDVAVDLRPGSPTRGQWVGEELCGEARRLLWIPEGFAHGFLVLSDEADVIYKTTNFYSPEHERCICWDDEVLRVAWPLLGSPPVVSSKDASGERFAAS